MGVLEGLEQLHPHVGLVAIRGHGAEEGHVDILQGREERVSEWVRGKKSKGREGRKNMSVEEGGMERKGQEKQR